VTDRAKFLASQQPGENSVIDSICIYIRLGWRRSSSANKNSVLREEYRREDQYLSIEIQPYIYTIHDIYAL